MDHVNDFKDLFELIPDYRKILIILIKNDVHLLHNCGFLTHDHDRWSKFLKNILGEQIEEH